MWLALALTAGLAVAAPTPAHADARTRPYRAVVLVTIDTLRADHLGVYGHPLRLTPAIDALAAESIVYERALATCPATAPSVASMLTGHHRAVHAVLRNGRRLSDNLTTLAEVLRADGFRTGAVVANDVLGHTGYQQGFESFTLATPDKARPPLFRDAPLLKTAGRLVRAFRGEPFFLWVHLMAPHGPYRPPPAYLRGLPRLPFVRPGDHALPLGHGVHGLGALLRYQYLGGRIDPAEYRRRYAGEIRYADDLVGALVNRLRRAGVWDDTLLVLTADHGESLGEHDLWFQHGWFAYDDTVRVPLVIRAPGRPGAGQRVHTTVSLVDLMPTVLDLQGLPPRPDSEGTRLLPRTTEAPMDRAAFAQNYYENRLTALSIGRWKYIHTPSPGRPRRPNDPRTKDIPTAGREELYDVSVDPDERRDLGAIHPDVLGRLRDRTERWLAAQLKLRSLAASFPRPPAAPLSPQHRRDLKDALRALGYAD